MAENPQDAPATGAAQASSRRLLNATAIMASGTLVSRLFGFVKASLLIVVLGASTPQADAYSLATLVPNSLYMIFAGGALNTVLVPQIVRHIRNDDDGGEAYVNRIMTAFLVVLFAVTALAMLFTPQVMSLWTSGAWRTPELEPHWTKLVLLGTLTMPQLFFYGAFFLIGQVLNARDRFGPMMWAPIINNIVAIGVLASYMVIWGTNVNRDVPFTTDQVLLLGLGSTAGIVVQTLALVPAARSVGLRYRPRWDLKGTGLGATFHLAKWMLGYVMLTTVAQAIVSRLASGATVSQVASEGAGVAAYNTAYIVWILPHSLLTVSLATAMLPSASRLAAAHDFDGVAAETTRTMRLANTFLMPASLGFIVLAYPITNVAFGYGAATQSWAFIGVTLMAFAVGLVPYTVQYVYLRGFYALEDTRTPFLIQGAISGTNVVLALGLMTLSEDPGTVAPRLALAYALAYFLGAWLTHRSLAKRLPKLSGRELVGHLAQLFVAALPGIVVAFGITWWFSRYWSRSLPLVALGVVLAGLAAILGYFYVARRLGITETTHLMSVLLRRHAASAPDPGDPPRDDAPATGAAAAPASGVGEGPLLVYPDPVEVRLRASADADLVGSLRTGQLLGQRYRLAEVLARRGGTVTWLASDLTLSRPVLLHVMDPHEPRTLQILDQARLAAPTVDARFLRVWDAVLVEGAEHGSFIVCEYSPGLSLELALTRGPLTEVEAAWVVREVADGLVAMHAKGLYHRQLNPDTIIITASGNVKIVGFLIEAALHPEPDDASDGEAQDVRGLGELLYACLLTQWPGGARYGLPAAPTDGRGNPLLPRQVTPNVSTMLDEIVDRILSSQPRGGASRLATAQDVAVALSQVLGGADASRELDRRLRFPVTPIRITTPEPPSAPLLSSPLAITADAGVRDAGPAEPTEPTEPGEPGEPGEPTASGAPGEPGASGTPDPEGDDATEAIPFDPFSDTAPRQPFTPVPPPAWRPAAQRAPLRGRLQPAPRRRWLAVLFGAFVLVLVVSLVLVLVGEYGRLRSQPVAASPFTPASVRDFDPSGDGGDDRENPDAAPQAVDGDPATAWKTEAYGRSADFNSRKPGAGLIIDLGEPRRVGQVTVAFGDGVTDAEIRVPVDGTATTPPLKSRNDWRIAGRIPAATGEAVVDLDPAVETRFVLVYLTKLPRQGANYVGAIHEVVIHP